MVEILEIQCIQRYVQHFWHAVGREHILLNFVISVDPAQIESRQFCETWQMFEPVESCWNCQDLEIGAFERSAKGLQFMTISFECQILELFLARLGDLVQHTRIKTSIVERQFFEFV